jgi:PAS domain S-box-containing protein
MAREGTLSLDGLGKIIRFSHSLEDMLGFGSEEAVGREFTFLAPKGMEGEFSSLLRLSDPDGESAPKKTGLLCKDGTVHEFYLSIYPLRDSSGALYSFMLSVSGRKMARPAILNDEFRRIFRFSNDSVAITDRDGSIIDVNQAFLYTYGYERHELLGCNPGLINTFDRPHEDVERPLDPSKGYWRVES